MSRLLDQDDILKWLGYDRPADAERALRRAGVRVIRGRGGRIKCTTGAIDRVLAGEQNAGSDDDDFQI